MPSSEPNARRTSSGVLQMKTPSDPAPSTGLTTALKGSDGGRSRRNVSTSAADTASIWPHAFSPLERTASVCKNLLRRRLDCALPLPRTRSASAIRSERYTPGSLPQHTSHTSYSSARTAATVASSPLASCCTVAAHSIA